MEGASNPEQRRRPPEHGPWRSRYDVSGHVVTTPDTLHLQAQVMMGGQEVRKLVLDATGIFTDSGKEMVELEEARLGTNDIGQLGAGGRRCFFTLAPTSFRVAFYDEQLETKLGELLARPLPLAGNPGIGLACWYPADPITHASTQDPSPHNDKDKDTEEATPMLVCDPTYSSKEQLPLVDLKNTENLEQNQSKSVIPSSKTDGD